MSDAPHLTYPLERMSTGIAGLDTILRGGFFRGGIYIVAGDPGAGKTIFANQMCFHHARSGEHVLYVTLLAENHSRMFAHLQSLTFFDPAPIGETLLYFSGYGALRNDGLVGLAQFLRQTIRQNHASLIVIDGLETVVDIAESTLALKRFLHELHVYVESTNCTLVLLAQLSQMRSMSLQTMADGVVELNDQPHDLRMVRELTVRKLRGSDYLRGRHLFDIDQRGIVVHPRTESLLTATRVDAVPLAQRLQIGVARLDEMLEGGLLRESTTMLLGTPGSGKTVLGLHMLDAGARIGELGLYFGSTERPENLVDKATRLGLQFNTWIEQGLIEVLWQPPLEPILDVLAERLLEAVRRRGVRRLFIDGIDAFQAAAYPERLPIFFTALLNELSALGVTTVVAVEMRELFGPTIEFPSQSFSANIDNIIFLRYVELRSQLYRLLSILKIRDSGYEPSIREFRITDSGIEVAATFESAEAILTGLARPLPPSSGLVTPTKRPRGSS